MITFVAVEIVVEVGMYYEYNLENVKYVVCRDGWVEGISGVWVMYVGGRMYPRW